MNAQVAKIINPVVKIGKKGIRFTKENSNAILTILAVMGFAVTAEELVRATIKAVKICEEKDIQDGKEIVRTVWKIYIPAAGFFLITTVAIIGNARLNAKKLATVTGLCAMNAKELKDFKDKAKEVIGPKKTEKMVDEIEKERLEKDTIPPEEDILKTGHGNQLFKEYLTGKYIRTSPEHVELVEERLNRQIEGEIDGVVMAGYYLQEFGIDPDCYIAEALWDMAEMLQRGDKKIKLGIHYGGWTDVHGTKEMVAVIKPDPLPTGI